MPYRHLQHSLIGTVVDGQVNLHPIDINVSHDIGAFDLELPVVLGRFLLCHVPEDARLRKVPVVGFSLRQYPVVICRIHLLDGFHVGCHRPGLVKGVPPIGESRVCHNPGSGQHHQDEKDGDRILLKPFCHELFCSDSAGRTRKSPDLRTLNTLLL